MTEEDDRKRSSGETVMLGAQSGTSSAKASRNSAAAIFQREWRLYRKMVGILLVRRADDPLDQHEVDPLVALEDELGEKLFRPAKGRGRRAAARKGREMPGSEFMFRAEDGQQLLGRRWLPDDRRPRAIVQIAHGLTEQRPGRHPARRDAFDPSPVSSGIGARYRARARPR
jgi:hypothetical protein